MSESFLHYIWQYQYFTKTDLLTTDGEPLQIFATGNYNTHAGPDFINARIKVGAMQWVGNVEIHIQASAWMLHRHDDDDAYNNVILHVVWKNDKTVVRKDGSVMPTLELRNRVDENLLLRYKRLVNSAEEIPCAAALAGVATIIKYSTLDRCLLSRLETKAGEVHQLRERNKGDWEETTYQLLARNFGFKVNAEPFLQLARQLPYRQLMKHADKPVQVEAMLFGMAGFLDERIEQDAYYRLLQREYNLLKQKFTLASRALHKMQWKFLRLRPANFPTVRLAQFASLLYSRKNIFSQLLESLSFTDIKALFENPPSAYWLTHYNFNKPAQHVPGLGEYSMYNILINTVVPLFAAYAGFKDDQVYMDRALAILQHIPAESNHIINRWNSIAFTSKTAFDSQALIELYNSFCSRRRCLDCTIGVALLKPN